ncbi:MAG: cytochrome c oxidase subunit II [Clostridia bacterium]|nr:cytochrome c oxidase subunit II [Clostridia bacterium]
MGVHAYERFWMFLSGLMLAAFLAAVGFSVFGMGIDVPGAAGTAPALASAAQAGPFAQPGVREVAPGQYEVIVSARAWQYQPNEIRVPAGSRVTFIVTSQDVIHGFWIQGTTVNTMVMPGEVTQVAYTFDKPGRYTFLCHEYCGTGHHVMNGAVIVQ